MKFVGYWQSNSDHTLFIKQNEGKVTSLIVYVDAMVLTGDDPEEMEKLQQYLATKFEMKDLGQLRYFLETGMLDCKPAETPMEMNQQLGISFVQQLTDKVCYQRLVRKLIYLTHTRPDIAYAVNVVS
ncbi:uncharacterized mitochondrial protein AtMg00810-like [Solanum stenotomum]|uniref:uncharacterized mitochondrial protein AtMg00810-like n=1 Tax=Solanum stenotomum TaxID=172797 RepID=UPI0020D023CE|nr:uncharacterized mitochondrial protein AtMg00810-like [Solanum stenotomum]